MKRTIVVNLIGDVARTFVHESNSDAFIVLEEVFAQFNHGSNQESELFLKSGMRSLSKHDCVRVDGQWYQCLSSGWGKVTEQFVDELEKKVVEHPAFNLHGAWYCLSDIMWKEHKRI